MTGVKAATDSYGRGLALYALGATQNLAYNAAGGSSAAVTLSSSAGGVRISAATGDVRVAIGKAPTASSSSFLLPHPWVVDFLAGPGDLVAALSNDTTTGTLGVAELQANPNTF